MKRTFVEKMLNAEAGQVVCCQPDIVLSHDNSARISKLFEKMGGENVMDPSKLLVVLDRKMIGTTDELIRDYNAIRNFMEEQRVGRFFDCDKGICHQVVTEYLKQGMLVVGNDSHTCTAGAFNCLAVGVNKTETAVLWKTGKMWFRVPETIKIVLKNALSPGVYAKDLALWVIGMLRNEHPEYRSIEYHGEGVSTLSISDRMTIANVSGEMGVKSSVFPPDDVLADYFGDYAIQGVWADEYANYSEVFEIDLEQVVPLVMVTNGEDEIKEVKEYKHLEVQQGLIGACACGRLEDLRVAAAILKGKKIADGFQLSIVPASRKIYLQAIEEGIIDTLFKAGASIMGASCGPCLGSSHMILADTKRFISTTNSNSMRRMLAIGVEKYVASPATVAMTALTGYIRTEVERPDISYPYWSTPSKAMVVEEYDNRRTGNVWDYTEIDDISCEQLFAERFTYHISIENAKAMVPYLLGGLDDRFSKQVKAGDAIIAGWNFGCGKLVKHAAVGLVEAGVKAIIVKSVSRTFFRMATNHGLLVIIASEIAEAYKHGDKVEIDLESGSVHLNAKEYALPRYDVKYTELIWQKGPVNASVK